MTNSEFIKTVWNYYGLYKREMPWRQINIDSEVNPYHVFVSEIMLQQTQVNRVLPKFNKWIIRFPDFSSLANASLADVLQEWNGLGYNRRAKYIHDSARSINDGRGGVIPNSIKELQTLPGVGPNTAAAILVYAFNKPHIFVETNIRSVYIYHFFKSESKVSDKHIKEKLSQTLDTTNPREWYWALMDYGTFLKKEVGNTATQSKNYAPQSAFKGSKRELRAKTIKLLLKQAQTNHQIINNIKDSRTEAVLQELLSEGLITSTNGYYHLP